MSYVETDVKTLVKLGEAFHSGAVVEDLWKWYREACDLAREVLTGPCNPVHRQDMLNRLKNLDSRWIL